MPDELSKFVRGLTTLITRRAGRYAERLDQADSERALWTDEKDLLNQFEQHVSAVLDRYVPPGPRKRDSLVFAHLYPAPDWSSGEVDERRRHLLTALLAADVEYRGPLRLTRMQSIRLAEIFRQVAGGLLALKLPLHAALGFERAAELYLQVEDHRARDQCLLAQAKARHRGPRPLHTKILEAVSEQLCGYGYQPYRLLGWFALQLAIFCIILVLISDRPVNETLYLALTGFISIPGLGDTREYSGPGEILFIVEGYLGVLGLSVFFALLVRRWFRL